MKNGKDKRKGIECINMKYRIEADIVEENNEHTMKLDTKKLSLQNICSMMNYSCKNTCEINLKVDTGKIDNDFLYNIV